MDKIFRLPWQCGYFLVYGPVTMMNGALISTISTSDDPLTAVLCAASMLGDYFGTVAVANSTGMGHGDTIKLLQEAVAAGILQRQTESKLFFFSDITVRSDYQDKIFDPAYAALLRKVVRWQHLQLGLVHQQLSWLRDEIGYTKQMLQEQTASISGMMLAQDIQDGQLSTALGLIAIQAAVCMHVSRVSIWQYHRSEQALQCVELYDASGQYAVDGLERHAPDMPEYFGKLTREHVFRSDEVTTQAELAPLLESYFLPHQIQSVLDVSFHLGPEWGGVVSFEHQGAPKRWKFEEMLFANAIAAVVSMAYYERREKERSAQMETSIRAALLIQQAILPDEHKLRSLFADHFVLYRPKDIVSGDFYWATQVEEKSFLAVTDCTGHGVPGAFMSMITSTLLDKIVGIQHILSPALILDTLHEEIRRALRQDQTGNNDGVDIGLMMFCREASGDILLHFSGAKILLYYWQEGMEAMGEIPAARSSLGGIHREVIHQNHIRHFRPGAQFYMGSDGLADQCDPARKRMGKDRLRQILFQHAAQPMQTQQAALEDLLTTFSKGTAQRDDILWIGCRL